MRDYFNLLDTPVYKFNGRFVKNSDNGDEMSITFTSGYDHTARYLIFNVLIYLETYGDPFNVSATLSFINNQPYQKLIVNEPFNSIDDYIQLPNTPRGAGSASSHVNFHPTTQNMYLVMNGDQFNITCSNMEVGRTVSVSVLAYTRTRVPTIDVFGGDLAITTYNNIG